MNMSHTHMCTYLKRICCLRVDWLAPRIVVLPMVLNHHLLPIRSLEANILLGTCSQMLRIKNKATQKMLSVKILRPP
jgi:hypothetical protein